MGGVSPIDMQVMITKSVEVAKQHGQEMHKGVKSQQDLVEQEKRVQEENTKKVHDRNSSERIYSMQDDDEEARRNKKNDNDSDSDSEEEDSSKENVSEENVEKKKNIFTEARGHFDIKI